MYFLNINKPKGISSFDCIRILRKKLGIKAIGHSGTLDPLASGVMQIAVGSATKLLDYLDSDKTYIADIEFGYISSTMDDEGEKTFISKPNFSKTKLKEVLDTFLGKTMQTPPKYSAIKENGKKYCDVLRKNPNANVFPKQREIYIYSIDLIDFNFNSAKISVHCKKGTYIRSLVNDIGEKLGCGAYIKELKRIKAGNFDIENSQELESSEFIPINPLDVLNLVKYEINNEEYKRIMNGLSIQTTQKLSDSNILLTKNNKLVSLAYLSDNLEGNNIIKPKKNFKEV